MTPLHFHSEQLAVLQKSCSPFSVPNFPLRLYTFTLTWLMNNLGTLIVKGVWCNSTCCNSLGCVHQAHQRSFQYQDFKNRDDHYKLLQDRNQKSEIVNDSVYVQVLPPDHSLLRVLSPHRRFPLVSMRDWRETSFGKYRDYIRPTLERNAINLPSRATNYRGLG